MESILMKNQKLECELTVLYIKDNIWFVGREIADILGYKNERDALHKHVRDKHKCKLRDLSNCRDLRQNEKVKPATVLISEPGLYSLIMHSKLEKAEDFQDWVVEDVLPSIRKTGQYKMKNHPIRKQLTFKIENEFDLQCKVVDFLKNQYPNSFFITPLGENQNTQEKRLRSHKLGYLKGMPDIIICNLHTKYNGFAIELKSPKGTGIVSDDQSQMLTQFKDNNFKTLVSNSYDECIVSIINYFEDVRIKCDHCSSRFKSIDSRRNHYKHFHKIEL
jgi:prophage antirepressor-like protein